MDARNSILIVGVCLLLAATATLLVLVGYRAYIRPSVGSHVPSNIALPQGPRGSLSTRGVQDPADYRAHRRQTFEDALERVEELKELLDKKTALVQEKSALLEKRTAEYEALRRETNQYISMMVEMASQTPWDGPLTASPEQEKKTASSLAEMERLEEKLEKSDAADQTLEAALDEATWELEQAYTEMADAELSAIVEVQMTIQSTAASVLSEIGAPAAIPLAKALTDESVDVRRWAAVVLGQMGADALAATDELVMATQDPDSGVRRAAREALTRIENDL